MSKSHHRHCHQRRRTELVLVSMDLDVSGLSLKDGVYLYLGHIVILGRSDLIENLPGL